MKTIDNTGVIARIGGDETLKLGADGKVEDATPARLIRFLVLQVPTETLKIGDVQAGARILEKVKEEPETIELEDGDFDWLRQAVNTFAPKILGMNAFRLLELVAEED